MIKAVTKYFEFLFLRRNTSKHAYEEYRHFLTVLGEYVPKEEFKRIIGG